jgi:hypothetical protein
MWNLASYFKVMFVWEQGTEVDIFLLNEKYEMKQEQNKKKVRASEWGTSYHC